MFQSTDIGKLLLRLTVGIMMLFHGFDKVFHGIDGVKFLVSNTGLPSFFAYGVYVGELVLPVLIILGIYSRIAALGLAFNMFVAIMLAYGSTLFSLGEHGAPLIELPLFYLVISLVIYMCGPGKFAVNSK